MTTLRELAQAVVDAARSKTTPAKAEKGKG